MMKKILFVFCLLAASSLANAQKNYSSAAAKADLSFLYETLKAAHPSLYRYTSKEDMDNLFQLYSLRWDKDSVSQAELGEGLNHFTSALHCVHTSMSNTLPAQSKKNFDMIFLVADGKLYAQKIKELGNDTTRYRILTINDIQASTIVQRLISLRSGDGYGTAFAELTVARNFNTYFNALYKVPDLCSLEVQGPKGQQDIIVKRVEKVKSASNLYLWEQEEVVDTLVGGKLLKIKSDPSVRVLRLSKFDSKFKKFYQSNFAEMASDSVETLVIDLRDNGGGNIYHAYELLNYLIPTDISFYAYRRKGNISKHLTNKGQFQWLLGMTLYDVFPTGKRWSDSTNVKHYHYTFKAKKYNYQFKNIVVLVNGVTVSSSSLVAAYLEFYTKAKVIGEETGGTYVGNNGRAFPEVELPNSKAKLRLPLHYIQYFPGVKDEGRGVKVEFEVPRQLNKEAQRNLLLSYLKNL